MSDNQIVEIVTQSELEPAKSQLLLQSFQHFFEAAGKVVSDAKDIIVKDETDTASMYEARTKRLELARIRIDSEKVRKSLKEQIVREGKAIDGVANVLKAMIAPVEEHLEKQEKFAELIQEQRKREKYEARATELAKFVDDISVYALGDITDELFNKILEEAKLKRAEQERLVAKAEEERLERERLAREEQERIAAENLRLKAEAEEMRKKQEAERLEAERKIAEERAKAEEAICKEREARAKIEEEQRVKAEAERLEAERVQREKEAEQEAERQKTLAPDKDKLNTFAEELKSIQMPTVTSAEAVSIVKKTESALLKLSQAIKESALKM